METILFFLANNIASGAIGHYISKGLGKIDKELPALIENESDLKKVREYISEKSLDVEVMKFSDKVRNKIENTNSGNILNFTGNNEGIVGNNIEIKTIRKNVKISAPQGTIASSAIHRNYSKYLIDRYHEFKMADVGKEKMKYTILYSAIKREFGAKWDMISLEKFYELSSFLQKRIDRTILGKNKTANKIKRYSCFEEYSVKHSS